jgi:phage gp46-like protein
MSGFKIYHARDFEGDLLLADTPDGGDIIVEDGLFACDRSFGTAVYLSLFGGNKDDAGRVKNGREWWGNTLAGTAEAEKMTGRFQSLLAGIPMTAKNIAACENAALLDLAWLKADGACDEIAADGRAGAKNRFYMTIELKARGTSVYKNTFSLFWREGLRGGV